MAPPPWMICRDDDLFSNCASVVCFLVVQFRGPYTSILYTGRYAIPIYITTIHFAVISIIVSTNSPKTRIVINKYRHQPPPNAYAFRFLSAPIRYEYGMSTVCRFFPTVHSFSGSRAARDEMDRWLRRNGKPAGI
jgi:hypothetical protein